MKFLMVLFLVLLLSVVGFSEMVVEKTKPDFQKMELKDGKSALVIVRTWGMGSWQVFKTYLDKTLIGVMGGKTYFIQNDINPGKHYVISVAEGENFQAVLVNFEAGKTYFLEQKSPPSGLRSAHVKMSEFDPATIADGVLNDCNYMVWKDGIVPNESLSNSIETEAVKEAMTLVIKKNGTTILKDPGEE